MNTCIHTHMHAHTTHIIHSTHTTLHYTTLHYTTLHTHTHTLHTHHRVHVTYQSILLGGEHIDYGPPAGHSQEGFSLHYLGTHDFHHSQGEHVDTPTGYYELPSELVSVENSLCAREETTHTLLSYRKWLVLH